MSTFNFPKSVGVALYTGVIAIVFLNLLVLIVFWVSKEFFGKPDTAIALLLAEFGLPIVTGLVCGETLKEESQKDTSFHLATASASWIALFFVLTVIANYLLQQEALGSPDIRAILSLLAAPAAYLYKAHIVD